MILAALLALAQAGAVVVTPDTVTVGDTVYVVRRIPVSPGVQPRLEVLEATAEMQPLRDPVARHTEGALSVAYTVAMFTTGRLPIPLPKLDLIFPDGRVETVATDTAWVWVASVLPAADTLPDPRPHLEPVPRRVQRVLPVAASVGAVWAVVLLWVLRRHRLGVRPDEPGEPDAGAPPVSQWVAAGELRAVAAVTTDRVRREVARLLPDAGTHLEAAACMSVIADQAPQWPVRQLRELLDELERARFAPVVPSDVVALVDEAEQLMVVLRGEPEEVAP